MSEWGIYTGQGDPHDAIDDLPPAPPWRTFQQSEATRGTTYRASKEEVEAVNTALLLRRPLLLTGPPGVGKSSLAYAVAHELKLGDVLRWPITTRSTLNEGLYSYDAIGRLQEANLLKLMGKELPDPSGIGHFIRLGPLGTALLSANRPRVLLIDEIDKSDIDLPNDLLHVFEDGRFTIPELVRLPDSVSCVPVMTWDSEGCMEITHGLVQCSTFPLVIMTSNGEREFPQAFLRRCLRLTIRQPQRDELQRIVEAHLRDVIGDTFVEEITAMIDDFLSYRDGNTQRQIEARPLATDQLLNAIYLATQHINIRDRENLRALILKSLNE